MASGSGGADDRPDDGFAGGAPFSGLDGGAPSPGLASSFADMEPCDTFVDINGAPPGAIVGLVTIEGHDSPSLPLTPSCTGARSRAELPRMAPAPSLVLVLCLLASHDGW